MEMISKPIQALLSQSSVIRAIFEEGEHLRGEYGSDKVYNFSLGNPDVSAPTKMEQAIHEVLTEEPSISVHGYMSNVGLTDLRTAIADSLQEHFGLAYHVDQPIVTTSAAAALNVLLKTVLSPGGEVLTFAPYFSEYKNYTQNCGDVLRLVATDPETFLPDLDALRKAIGEKARALILSTPNSPSGVVYSEEVLRDVQRVLVEKEREFGSCILVISDEPYRELVYDDAVVPWIPALVPHATVVYSYSKILSFPGECIGWLLLPDSTPEARELYAATVITNRISGFINTPLPIQRVLKRTLGCRADFSVYEHDRALPLRELPKVGYQLVKPEDAFYLLIQAPEDDDTAFAATLKEERILTVPCKSFAYPGHVRLAYCVAETTIWNVPPGFRRTARSYKAKGLL